MNKQQESAIAVTAILCSLCFSQSAVAAEKGTFAAEIGLSQKSLDFEFKDAEGSTSFDESHASVDLAAFYQTEKFYASFHIEIPQGEAEGDGKVGSGDLYPDAQVEGEISRSDRRITFGFKVNPQFTLFVGRKDGKTELDWDWSSQTYSNQLADPQYKENTDADVEDSGLFFGGSYVVPVADIGGIGISVAVADLDIDLSGYLDVTSSDPNIEQDWSGSFSESGSADAVSVSIKWSGALSETMRYYVGANFQDWDTKIGGEVNMKVTQEILTYGLGLTIAL